MADLAQQFGENTLDEPVSETIMRDVRLVARRLALVVMPGISSSTVRAELRDWDLWGPLFICMSLAVMLSLKAHDEASLVFSVIFVIMWLGAAVVTVNGQLLGGRLSFFQSVCLLGYCVFPILLSAAACLTINSFVPPGIAVIARFAAVVFALFWALFASSSFMTDAKFPEGRKVLALYPVFLFYLSLAWMVTIGFQQGSSGTGLSPQGAAPPNPAATTGGEAVADAPAF